MKTFYRFAVTAKVSEMTRGWNQEKEGGCGWKSIYPLIQKFNLVMVFCPEMLREEMESLDQ